MANAAGQDLAEGEFFRTGDAARVLADRTASVDDSLRQAFETFLAAEFPRGLAVLAVGGFGRRELFPHSDVDVLVLVEQAPRTPAGRDALAAFLRSLWDRGLRLGHSVHTPAECCVVDGRNIELSISLLDERFLAGDAELYGKLRLLLPRFFAGRREELINHLLRLTRVRHARYSNTIYHMEPDVKETPGALRDSQLVRWLSQLRSAEPVLELEAAKSFLSTLRCFLHYRGGRDNNLLTFDAQEEITEQPFIPHRDPAVWMRDYYLHARAIYRAATRAMELSEPGPSGLLSQFRDWRSRVSTSEFTVSRERVLLRNPHLVAQEPETALRLFIFLARHGIRLAADSARRIEESLPSLSAKLAALPSRWSLFKEMLSLPHAALALEAMHETGVLAVLIPEWAAIECLVVRDFYHRYTVDEHTLVAVQALGDLPGAKDAQRQRFAALLEEVEERHLLLLALLLHDTGKSARSGQHVAESLRLAASAMERLGVPEDARKTVAFLIERHLDLSRVMSARDLDEPSTARFLAERCDTVERLKQLVLLTYADISAVNPSAMTPWRLEQLWRVHLAANAELTRELDTERIASPPASTPEMAAFLEGFPTRYARVHSEEELRAHLALDERARAKGVAVEVSKRNGTYSLALAAQDRPALLSSIAGVLAGFGMNILKAEAFSNRRGMILDTFVFEDPKRTLDLNPTEVDRLRLSMERVVLGKTDVKQFLQNRPRPTPPSKGSRVRTAVTFNSEVSATSTLVEVLAQDRPGLLYDLTSTISSAGCNIEVVLVDTEAHKALDVFYVTSGGKKLTAGQLVTLKESLLRACRG